MGEDGIEKLKLANVEALKKETAGPALLLLKLVRAISPGSAFIVINKQMAYQLQWITPFSITELTRNKAVIDAPHCKILDFPDVDNICRISCQSVYPVWMSEHLNLRMEVNRQGDS